MPINVSPLSEGIPEPCIEETKVANRKDVHSLLTLTEILDLSSIIDCERYATAQRLYRITAYVLKFINMLRKRAQSPELTIQDIAETKRLWIVHCQSVLVKDITFQCGRLNLASLRTVMKSSDVEEGYKMLIFHFFVASYTPKQETLTDIFDCEECT